MAKGLDAFVAANQTIARGKKKLNAALKATKRGETKARRQYGDLLKELVLDHNDMLKADLLPGMTPQERETALAESRGRIQNRVTGYLLSYRDASDKDLRLWDQAGAKYWAEVEEDAQRVREPFEITYPVPEHELGPTLMELKYRDWHRTSKFLNRWEGEDDYDSARRLAAVHSGRLRRIGAEAEEPTLAVVTDDRGEAA